MRRRRTWLSGIGRRWTGGDVWEYGKLTLSRLPATSIQGIYKFPLVVDGLLAE
jgi:hypothetical protein